MGRPALGLAFPLSRKFYFICLGSLKHWLPALIRLRLSRFNYIHLLKFHYANALEESRLHRTLVLGLFHVLFWKHSWRRSI